MHSFTLVVFCVFESLEYLIYDKTSRLIVTPWSVFENMIFFPQRHCGWNDLAYKRIEHSNLPVSQARIFLELFETSDSSDLPTVQARDRLKLTWRCMEWCLHGFSVVELPQTFWVMRRDDLLPTGFIVPNREISRYICSSRIMSQATFGVWQELRTTEELAHRDAARLKPKSDMPFVTRPRVRQPTSAARASFQEHSRLASWRFRCRSLRRLWSHCYCSNGDRIRGVEWNRSLLEVFWVFYPLW